MTVKTIFNKSKLNSLLSRYDLGKLKDIKVITSGNVQTNYILFTSQDKFVFRYYENRSRESVSFEIDVINKLNYHDFPCPAILKNEKDRYFEMYNNKPYVIMEFIEGRHIENLKKIHLKEIINKIGKLHKITGNYQPPNIESRLNYNIKSLKKLGKEKVEELNSCYSQKKFNWLLNIIDELELPQNLTRGVCHCDFHYTNLLFEDNKLKSLLDFDDANYTYLIFDLVNFIDYYFWPHDRMGLDFTEAAEIIAEYQQQRKLNKVEKKHIFDVYKMGILFDCIWFFERGNIDSFYEKRKIEYLDQIGREKFYKILFD